MRSVAGDGCVAKHEVVLIIVIREGLARGIGGVRRRGCEGREGGRERRQVGRRVEGRVKG